MKEKDFIILNGGVFVETEDILLRIPSMEDMEGLFEVDRLENDHDHDAFENDTARGWWKDMHFKLYRDMDQESLYFSIIDVRNHDFLGRFIAQGYKSVAPEIGIILTEEYQGMGIAAKVITSYMAKAREFRDIPYFSARIKSNNEYSQKMIKKLKSEEVMMIRDTHCYKIF